MTFDAFKAYLDRLPAWADRARLISRALDLLPVGAIVGQSPWCMEEDAQTSALLL